MPPVKKRRLVLVPRLREPVLAAREEAFDRLHPALLLAAALLASGLVHLAAADLGARLRRGREAPWPHPAAIKVAVVERPEAPAPVPAAAPGTPEAEPRRRILRTTAPRTSAKPRPAAPPPAPESPPLPVVPSAPAASNLPPLLVPGVALSATSSAGTVGVRVGGGRGAGSASGAPGGGAEGAAEASGEIAPAYSLTEEPVFLDNISGAEMRKYYPEEARKGKVEGNVRVKLLVDDRGSVGKATVLDDPTGMFRSAAIKVARLYRFKPAKIGGRRVATEIEFTIHFELD